MNDSSIRLTATILTSTMLVAAGGWTGPPGPPQQRTTVGGESSCRPAADLDPRASAGTPQRVPSTLARSGELLRWAAGTGDTLRLRLFAAETGTYTLSLLAMHGRNGPVMSAKLWEDRLTRKGERSIALQRVPGPEILAVRFDPVSLGPGHHILELSCLESGDFLLDCVALRRTGDLIVPRPGDGAGGRPFLGVEMGGARAGGVAITRTIPGSAAAEAGLEAGDVLVRIAGEPMDTSDRVAAAVLRHRPGEQLELALLRDGELLEKVVTLGRRLESNRRGGSRAAPVIKVLDVQPGQVIADIGSGSGWLSEAIAETLGTDGLVYAVEIDETHVRRLRRWSNPNVVPVFSVPDDVSLPENSLDTAMLHDVASHVDRAARPRFYESVARALKREGRLFIFDPHGGARSMLDELREYGFVPLGDEAEGDLDRRLQNGIVFRYSGTAPE